MAHHSRFSVQAREILVVAQQETDERRHNLVDTDHILLAIISQSSSVGASKILRDCGADYEQLSILVGQNPYKTGSKRLELSRDAKQVLELAVEELKNQGERQITAEHLLIGILQLETSAGVELLFQAGCNIKQLYATMDVALPAQVIRQHQQHVYHQAEASDDVSFNEGCVPSILNRVKELLTGGSR